MNTTQNSIEKIIFPMMKNEKDEVARTIATRFNSGLQKIVEAFVISVITECKKLNSNADKKKFIAQLDRKYPNEVINLDAIKNDPNHSLVLLAFRKDLVDSYKKLCEEIGEDYIQILAKFCLRIHELDSIYSLHDDASLYESKKGGLSGALETIDSVVNMFPSYGKGSQ